MASISSIPPPFCELFRHYERFNHIQSKLLDDVLQTQKSIVLSAPTGSGKTVIFELAIVKLLMEHQKTHWLPDKFDDFKIVYVAPLKALCTEKFLDWKPRFLEFGVSVLEVTGDTDIPDINAIKAAQVLVTTPEKWDSLTRKKHDCCEIVNVVRLFMIDEVHLLNEDVRGPTLEAIVSRMKTVYNSKKDLLPIRFIAASATIPNIEDISLWLGGKDNTIQHCFTDEQRPVPLEKHIIGFNSKLQGFKFDMNLNYKLSDIIRKYSNRKPTLIFCSSRKSTEMATKVLEKERFLFSYNDSQKTALSELARKLKDVKLRSLVERGIAFHHAGLVFEDRNMIENSFRNGFLMILISTNTLAMGVNLPAHLVIIKSTERYINGYLTEYPESTLLQMIGRAGRPQYDVKGVAVIMTQTQNVHKYEQLMNGRMCVESNLHKHLAEHLNSEIVLHTIGNLEVAMEWIRSTYLYVRAVRCPVNYGFAANMNRAMVEKKLEEMCLCQINELCNYGLVSKNETDVLHVEATPYGKLMAKYYISFETMKLFRQIRGTETFLEIFNIIVRSKEFSEFNLRVNEKKHLNELNASSLRFPIRGRVKTKENKISCLIQANFGNLQISDPSMIAESLKMIRIGDRISKCLFEYIRLSQNQLNEFSLGCYEVLLHTATLTKCFHSKLWENSEYASKQLRKVGIVYSSLLVDAGKRTLKSISDTDPRSLERILNKQPPFGDEILQNLKTFPEYLIDLALKSSDLLQVCVKQMNANYLFDGCNAAVIVGDSLNNLLLFDNSVDSVISEYGIYERTFKIIKPEVESIYANVIHSTLVGVDQIKTLVLNETPQKDKEMDKKLKTRKRAHQSTLNVSRSNKSKNQTTATTDKTVLDDSLSDFDMMMTKTNNIGESAIDNASYDVTEISADSYKKKIELYKFAKPILQQTTTPTPNGNITTETDDILEKSTTSADSNINTSCTSHNENHKNLEQSKLTTYFPLRKTYSNCIYESQKFNDNTITSDANISINGNEKSNPCSPKSCTGKTNDNTITFDTNISIKGNEKSNQCSPKSCTGPLDLSFSRRSSLDDVECNNKRKNSTAFYSNISNVSNPCILAPISNVLNCFIAKAKLIETPTKRLAIDCSITNCNQLEDLNVSTEAQCNVSTTTINSLNNTSTSNGLSLHKFLGKIKSPQEKSTAKTNGTSSSFIQKSPEIWKNSLAFSHPNGKPVVPLVENNISRITDDSLLSFHEFASENDLFEFNRDVMTTNNFLPVQNQSKMECTSDDSIGKAKANVSQKFTPAEINSLLSNTNKENCSLNKCSDDIIKMSYKISQEFLKFKTEYQTFENFKKLYKNFSNNNDTHPELKNETYVTPTGRQKQEDIASVSFMQCNTILSQNIFKQNMGEKSPYRLQLFSDHENHYRQHFSNFAKTKTIEKSVTQINKKVMRELLDSKCEIEMNFDLNSSESDNSIDKEFKLWVLDPINGILT